MRAWRWMLGSWAFFLSGCVGDVRDVSEEVLEARTPLVEGNKLSSNSLALNSLALNSLALNSLALNSMDSQSLAAIQDPGSQGALARAFLRYAIGCAFDVSQSLSFSFTDAAGLVHEETYHGELGLAPEWATTALDYFGQRMVSACVVARVNYYEVPVLISMRSAVPPLHLAPAPELSQFPHIEGAFWGNLWGSSPAIYACYKRENVANSRAFARDCAAGHLRNDGTIEECGMIDIVGPCDTFCSTQKGDPYYQSCIDQPRKAGKGSTQMLVTTALP
ncbi:hypothetical protein [Polyangium spumosum]|uniref:Lipoprotein n=1 Tax=Polyangium spumosum TaxID=889282 RepID=A0A6N7Q4H4_9BACT|nr:hypothetical protein [Polyangium spumosum]MRG95761.1 hypothetical protein [Polyangium spumosum]